MGIDKLLGSRARWLFLTHGVAVLLGFRLSAPWRRVEAGAAAAAELSCVVIVTFSGANATRAERALRGALEHTPAPRRVVLIDDAPPARHAALLAAHRSRDSTLDVLVRTDADRADGGLSALWNEGARRCARGGAASVALLNDDVEPDVTFAHLFQSIHDGARRGERGVFTCATDRAPWGEWMHQQVFLGPSRAPIVGRYSQADAVAHAAATRGSAKPGHVGLGGFLLAMSTDTLMANRLVEASAAGSASAPPRFFDERVPWGGNEREFNQRWADKGGTFSVVHSCFVRHASARAWLRRVDAWQGDAKAR